MENQFQAMKFRVDNPKQMENLQNTLFSQGYSWNSNKSKYFNYLTASYLYTDDSGNISKGFNSELFSRSVEVEMNTKKYLECSDYISQDENFTIPSSLKFTTPMQFKIDSKKQSEQLQEVLFSLGCCWSGFDGTTISHTATKFIHVRERFGAFILFSGNYPLPNTPLTPTDDFIAIYSSLNKKPNTPINSVKEMAVEAPSAFWGHHLMLDCGKCDIHSVSDYDNIKEFLEIIVARIGMIAVGEPNIEYLCEGDPKEGWTAMQMISTSSIVGHFMNSGSCYIDIFSCKEFDIELAKRIVRLWFKPESMRVNYITRDAG